MWERDDLDGSLQPGIWGPSWWTLIQRAATSEPQNSLPKLSDARKAQQSDKYLTQTGRTGEGCRERILGQREFPGVQ